MALNLDSMKDAFQARLPAWRQRMQQAGVTSVYSFISAMALWPVAAAIQTGSPEGFVALGGVLSSVGASLIANQLQNWKSESEADVARKLEAETSADLRSALDELLEKFEAIAQARRALPEAERAWFDEMLKGEGIEPPAAASYTAYQTGSGGLAQGAGATAAGQGGAAIGGHVSGSIITGQNQKPKPSDDRC